MSRRILTRSISAALTAILVVGSGVATAAAQVPVPVKREILALYDGAQEGHVGLTRIHRFAEMPLNYLGLIVRFRDVRGKLPERSEMSRYRGVLTWFVGSVPNTNAFLSWASRVSLMKIPYVILGDIGIPVTSTNLPAVNQLLNAAGVHHTGDSVAPALGTRVVQKDPGLVEFECQLDPSLPDYPVVEPTRAATQIGLTLESPAGDGKRRAALVAIGTWGGYAALNYEFCHPRPPLYQGRWLINPFAFFRAAFDIGDAPIPDTTTASGNRLYFGRLATDGWAHPSRIEGFRDPSATAGEVVMRELIEAFRDLPVTIEPRPVPPGEASGSAQDRSILPRASASPNVDLSTRRLGTVLSRFDAEYPSVSDLAPLVGAGPDHPINEAISAENGYGVGSGPRGDNGFVALDETVTNTDAPLRLKPFNLNYSAYAGEYPARLRSVRDHLRAARGAAITPISANRYADIVDGFFSARIDRIGSAAWRISNRGALPTVRFDHAEGREADFEASVGVIGERRRGPTLYVALDPSKEPAVVVLGSPTATRTQTHPFLLVQSRWLVRDVEQGRCALRFSAQGYGNGSFSWFAVPSTRYEISVDRTGQQVWTQTSEADDAGRLEFVVPVSAIDPVRVNVRCKAARSAKQ